MSAPAPARPAQQFAAEALGTFCLVFAGTGAIVVDQLRNGAVTHPGIAMVFGLVVMAMIFTFGDVSGAHLNPAVSVAFWLAGRLPGRDLPRFVTAQLLGALLASLLLHLLFPHHPTLGRTAPTGPAAQSFGLELVLTAMLMLVILAVAHGPKEKGLLAAIAIGGTVGLEALFAGPISGASMNPARSLAPALVSGERTELWVYLVGPFLGAAMAVPLARMVWPQPRAHPGP